MKFTKMHGLGNDFIVPEDVGDSDVRALAVKLCDRHTGIGADGLLIVAPSSVADVRMRIINSDGSEAEMCGNGIRCFSRYVFERGIVSGKEFSVETLAGIMHPKLADNGSDVTVDMGTAKIMFTNEILSVCNREFLVSFVLMGVPHLVAITDILPCAEELSRLGAALEKHERFENGTNVNFVKICDNSNIQVQTWERGCGITLACGTGACASAVLCHALGLTDSVVSVSLLLGCLKIDLTGTNVLMTGGCETAFNGEI